MGAGTKCDIWEEIETDTVTVMLVWRKWAKCGLQVLEN